MASSPLKVLLGVTGGIAAVKAPEIVRRLRECGHEVRCVLTRNAQSLGLPLPPYGENDIAANERFASHGFHRKPVVTRLPHPRDLHAFLVLDAIGSYHVADLL